MSATPSSDSAQTRLSQEETDHLIHSAKKIKDQDSLGDKHMDISSEDTSTAISSPPLIEKPPNNSTPTSPPPVTLVEEPQIKSFKETLAAAKGKDFYFDEITGTISPDDEDDDGDTNIHEETSQGDTNGISSISLPKKLIQQIGQP
ncbi:hypothetical protein LOK49_LG05G01848 [Camellia lanceoleosa]|uniref:Uncharacterized protein n=1 Tax=Camellia lanceoleosa TaxID=1840588 RepID=A0ACC0HIU8_9ERIC|nr:hypothetical protein LOK49_LG05G01848 [Camellia lanceoleosa]